MTGTARTVILGALLALVAACAGCSTSRQLELTVSLDEGIRTPGGYPTLEVDLVGVTATDALRGVDPDAYFALNSEWRRRAVSVSMSFSNEQSGTQTLNRNDPVWSVWREAGAIDLLVLVDHLPRSTDSRTRRLVLPLDVEEWESGSLDIVVYSNHLRCITPRKVPDK